MACWSRLLRIAIVTVVSVAGSAAQQRIAPPIARERADMPEAMPTRPQVSSPSASAGLRGPGVTIVQANVNAAGQNIVGDAANEPSLAVDPTNPNRLVIGWRQFNTISSNFRQAGFAYSSDAGRTWHFPGVITPGTFRSDPVLGADLTGSFFYYTLRSVGSSFFCEMFKSANGGQTWAGPVYAYGGDKAWMTIDQSPSIGRGNVYAHWTSVFSCCANTGFTRSINTAASFETSIDLVGEPFYGTTTVGPNGELYVLGASGAFNGLIVLRSDDAKNDAASVSFPQATLLPTLAVPDVGNSTSPNPAGLLGQGWIDVDRSGGPNNGNVYVVWSLVPESGIDPLDVFFFRSTDGGQTFSNPVLLNTDAGQGNWNWFATMSVAPNGRIDVAWNDTRGTAGLNFSRLYYRSSSDGGLTWSTEQVLTSAWNSFLGWPNQQKIGDYYQMVSDNAGAGLAFSATFNGEQDVYYARIGSFPCIGDLNNDRAVDESDLGILLSHWQLAVPPHLNGDANGDAFVDSSDLGTLLSNWRVPCP
ncbi:MAG: hypothetical protein U1D55_18295 [Phycisphaerae bacterium]